MGKSTRSHAGTAASSIECERVRFAASVLPFLLLVGCGRFGYGEPVRARDAGDDHDAEAGDGGRDRDGTIDVIAPPVDVGPSDAPRDDGSDAASDADATFDADAEPDADAEIDADPADADATPDADATSDADATPDADAMPDADAGPTGRRGDVTALAKLSVDQPVLAASTTQTDCTWRIVEADAREPRIFQYQGQIWFGGPCKAETGQTWWNFIFASWDGTSATATFEDADAAAGGVQALVHGNQATILGGILRNSLFTHFVAVGDELYGISRTDSPAIADYHSWPVYTSTRGGLDGLDYRVDVRDNFRFALMDGSWLGQSGIRHSILYEGGTFYVFFESQNAPISSQSYIGVVTTNDLTTTNTPTGPLLTDYERPFVAVDGASYHMVALHRPTQSWHYIRGSSLVSWDIATMVDLDLSRFIGATGAWDEQRFASLISGDPRVIGITIFDGTFYVFYVAGTYSPASAWAWPSGVGVLTMPMVD